LFIRSKTIIFIEKNKQVTGNNYFCTQMLLIFGAFRAVWCFMPAHLQLFFLFWYEDYLDRSFKSAVWHIIVRNFSLSCILAADVMVRVLFGVYD